MAEGGGGGGAGGGGGGSVGGGSASSAGGSSTGTSTASPPAGLSNEAMAQSRSAGMGLQKNGVASENVTEATGPNADTKMNRDASPGYEGGGYHTASGFAAPASDRTAEAGQSLNRSGVTTNTPASQADSKSWVDSNLGNNAQATNPASNTSTNQNTTSPQSDASFKQAADTGKTTEPTTNPSTPEP